MNTIRTYYQLTKPGIIRGNLLAATAGFFLASQGIINFTLLVLTLLGIALVIACGCVLNNYIDRDIDTHMARTQRRALVNGTISTWAALWYAMLLGGFGFSILATYTNLLTTFLGVLGLFFYVVVYGIAKRRSHWGTIIGSISGALPPVAGYTSVSSTIDIGALLLFASLVTWQMPHFYAISIYRLKDYTAANIPVLPRVKGIPTTQRRMILYIGLFIGVSIALSFYANTSAAFAVVMAALGTWWAILGLKGIHTTNPTRWARGMFGFSLLVLLLWAILLMIDSIYTVPMILGFHIVIATLGLLTATSLWFSPSASRVRTTYVLLALTLISGTYLIFAAQAHSMQTCLSGILYTAALLISTFYARQQLAIQKVPTKSR